MKLASLRLPIISLIIAVNLFSCKKNNEYPENIIIGKWKLVEARGSWGEEDRDYSQYNIVFEFKLNGVLSVTGLPDNYWAIVDKNGKHSYSLYEEDAGYGLEKKIQIGNSYWWYGLGSWNHSINTSIGLHITLAPIDGGHYEFVKL